MNKLSTQGDIARDSRQPVGGTGVPRVGLELPLGPKSDARLQPRLDLRFG
jgi:hypothetical protein